MTALAEGIALLSIALFVIMTLGALAKGNRVPRVFDWELALTFTLVGLIALMSFGLIMTFQGMFFYLQNIVRASVATFGALIACIIVCRLLAYGLFRPRADRPAS